MRICGDEAEESTAWAKEGESIEMVAKVAGGMHRARRDSTTTAAAETMCTLKTQW
jgi:hypothetical protein